MNAELIKRMVKSYKAQDHEAFVGAVTAATLQQAIEQHCLAATHRPGRENSRQGGD